MKSTLLFFCIILSHIAFCQTKDETIKWLNSKLEYNRPVEYNNLNNRMEAKSTIIKSDGSFNVKTTTRANMNSTEEIIMLDKGYLKNASLKSVSINKSSGGKYLYLIVECYESECFQQINFSPHQTTINGAIEKTYKKNGTCLAVFFSNEQELAERCKKAICHLISLCGAPKEPF